MQFPIKTKIFVEASIVILTESSYFDLYFDFV